MTSSLRLLPKSTRNDSITEKEEEQVFENFELMVLIYISGSICVTGVISNSLSLSFFLLNWSKRLGEKLLVLLNIFDLAVCLTDAINFSLSYHPSFNNVHEIIKGLFLASYFTFLECTGFVTTLMTLVRTFATYFPFSKPNEKYLTWSWVAFFIHSAVKSAVTVGLNDSFAIKVYNILLLTSLFVNIFVVFVANILTMAKLLFSAKRIISRAVQPSARKNREATVTIFILSACFCTLNLIYAIVLCNVILGKETISVMFRNVIVFGTIPLNSALNPFVYFIRKRAMRRFFSNLSRCSCAKTEVSQLSTASVAVNSMA